MAVRLWLGSRYFFGGLYRREESNSGELEGGDLCEDGFACARFLGVPWDEPLSEARLVRIGILEGALRKVGEMGSLVGEVAELESSIVGTGMPES